MRMSLGGSPSADAACGWANARATAAAAIARLASADDTVRQQRDDHHGGDAGQKRHEGEQEDEPGVAPAHPCAWSTRTTLNGGWPGIETENERPQRPTITSDGTERLPYAPAPCGARR